MKDALKALGIKDKNSGTFAGKWLEESDPQWLSSISPVDGKEIAQLSQTSEKSYQLVIEAAEENFSRWRMLPAPKRGEIIRQIAERLREFKEPLAKLITYEMGKILPEAQGEVQEAIDIADFSVGLSRQLYGNTMHSEREQHRMYEQWHPLGLIGVITAFNFPAAVWAWNSMIAGVCGNSVIWKPSKQTPLTGLAMTNLCGHVAEKHGFPALFTMVSGPGSFIGQKMAEDRRMPLISATGSCRMGQHLAQTVAGRFGRSILELGGNNAIIVLDDANLNLAVRAIVFGAVGTAGQRCTTTRRILAHKDIHAELSKRLVAAYKQVSIGNPLEPGVLMGPLVNESAVKDHNSALQRVPQEGGMILCGGEILSDQASDLYVTPVIVQANKNMPLVQEETFAPILYIIPIENLHEAIEVRKNGVPQGLSSAIFTDSLAAAEEFLSHRGSDCGIANVNIGTSGAEIGGAFGGEKDTGGGREAGSDSWKAYMRRQTNTINWGDQLPLAQGISFV